MIDKKRVDEILLALIAHLVAEHDYEPNKKDIYDSIDTKLLIGLRYNVTIQNIINAYFKMCTNSHKEMTPIDNEIFKKHIIQDFLYHYPNNDIYISIGQSKHFDVNFLMVRPDNKELDLTEVENSCLRHPNAGDSSGN